MPFAWLLRAALGLIAPRNVDCTPFTGVSSAVVAAPRLECAVLRTGSRRARCSREGVAALAPSLFEKAAAAVRVAGAGRRLG